MSKETIRWDFSNLAENKKRLDSHSDEKDG
jgi:hypothetical protein